MSVAHVTLRAIAYLRGRNFLDEDIDTSACDRSRLNPYEPHVAVADINYNARLPTCPECLVLWDAAQEVGTPPAPRPAHGPTDGSGEAA